MKLFKLLLNVVFVFSSTIFAFGLEQVSPTVYRPPADLEVTHMIEDSNKYIEWWAPGTPKWLFYASVYNKVLGTNESGIYDAAIKFDAEDLLSVEGYQVTSFGFVPAEQTATYIAKVWTGEKGDILVYSDTVVEPEIGAWNYFKLNSTVWIESGQTYYFGYTIISKGGYPIGCEDSENVVPGKSDLLRFSDEFVSVYKATGEQLSIDVAVYAELPSKKPVAVHKVKDNTNRSGNLSKLKSAHSNKIDVLKKTLYKGAGSPDSYKVYRDDLEIATTYTNNYEDILSEGGIYNYKVSAIYGDIESPKSEGLDVMYDTKRIPVNKVVTETFINVGGGSPASASVFKGMSELEYINKATMAPITYHAATEILGDDPFSNYNAEQRFMYYLISTMSFPMALFNGDVFLGGGSDQDLLPYYKELYKYALIRETPISLNGNMEKINSSTYKLNVDAEIVGMYKDSNMVLRVALVENIIDYAWSDSAFTAVTNVVRNMYPSATGTPVQFTDNKASMSINLNFDQLANPNDFKIVAFIQDEKTQQILNGDQFAFPVKKNVTFTVSNNENLAIEGATISISDEEFETDAEGKRVIGIWNNAGEVSYTVAHPDYDQISGVFNIDTTSVININMLSTDVEVNASNFARVYPNPANNTFTVEIEKASGIKVVNNTGKVIKSFNQSIGKQSYNVSDLKPGVYLVQIQYDNSTIVKRLVKL